MCSVINATEDLQPEASVKTNKFFSEETLRALGVTFIFETTPGRPVCNLRDQQFVAAIVKNTGIITYRKTVVKYDASGIATKDSESKFFSLRVGQSDNLEQVCSYLSNFFLRVDYSDLFIRK